MIVNADEQWLPCLIFLLMKFNCASWTPGCECSWQEWLDCITLCCISWQTWMSSAAFALGWTCRWCWKLRLHCRSEDLSLNGYVHVGSTCALVDMCVCVDIIVIIIIIIIIMIIIIIIIIIILFVLSNTKKTSECTRQCRTGHKGMKHLQVPKTEPNNKNTKKSLNSAIVKLLVEIDDIM